MSLLLVSDDLTDVGFYCYNRIEPLSLDDVQIWTAPTSTEILFSPYTASPGTRFFVTKASSLPLATNTPVVWKHKKNHVIKLSKQWICDKALLMNTHTVCFFVVVFFLVKNINNFFEKKKKKKKKNAFLKQCILYGILILFHLQYENDRTVWKHENFMAKTCLSHCHSFHLQDSLGIFSKNKLMTFILFFSPDYRVWHHQFKKLACNSSILFPAKKIKNKNVMYFLSNMI